MTGPGIDISPLVLSMSGRQLTVLAIMIAGFLFMCGTRRWAQRAFLLALVFLVISVFGPGWLLRP